LLLSSINKKEADNSLQQLQCFSNVIDVTKLAVELKQLPVFLDLFNADNKIPITSVTSVASVMNIMNFKPSFKKCAPQVHTLLLLYNSVGFSSATAERSFSAMRRIKTWLRSTMSANTLNNSMFAVLHKPAMDALDTTKLAKVFISTHERKEKYFGKV